MDRHELNHKVNEEANWMHRHASILMKDAINPETKESATEVVRLVDMMRESSVEMRVMLVKRALANMLELEEHIRDGILDRFNKGNLPVEKLRDWMKKSVSREELLIKKLDDWEHNGEADMEEEAWR